MYITLDLKSAEPFYTQLKHQIIACIAEQEFSPGDDALPSVQSLASDHTLAGGMPNLLSCHCLSKRSYKE
ncbi:hypothetical protein [Bacillus sp. EB600]|uniref:hypothetical protein n=1 Tax=Bacillus sp. EB600 TaxID=2806345 RepID=UPI00210AF612|nr:hypothetical protein [Bacillus sp. EB600]MCQ6279407.1 hypothetical protein [Bacillus sp. EB600]